jgi:RimJ/RimL family protein N-acetyltransferase
MVAFSSRRIKRRWTHLDQRRQVLRQQGLHLDPGVEQWLDRGGRGGYRLRVLPGASIVLSTVRLTLRPLGLDDLEEFVAYRQDPAVARFQGWEPSFSLDDGRALILAQPSEALPPPGGWLQLAVHTKNGALVGDVAVHALEDRPNSLEIGVTLARAAQGAGLATEALTALLGHLRTDVGASRVVAVCDSRNEPVARLLQRVGLRRESSETRAEWFKGEWITLDTYAV